MAIKKRARGITPARTERTSPRIAKRAGFYLQFCKSNRDAKTINIARADLMSICGSVLTQAANRK